MKKIVFLTGAGMSAESGISTFRDSGGLWEQYPVEKVASIEGYWEDRQLVLQFYNERRNQLPSVQPNKGHVLVAQMEKNYDVTVVTQNVDNLHERAGSTHIVHLHGELMKATSERNPNDPNCIITLKEGEEIHLGDKAKDGSQLRPFIVWFGESVPEIETAVYEVMKADILVIIGTSLNVYPAAGLINYANENTPIYVIDPKPVQIHSNRNITFIQKGASEGMEILSAKFMMYE
ncbi:MAG: Sir2 family NAD-dependent protein deacetylase [Bacteroidales bacterium]|nr:Sir2 family NAD-dependent protein deacetylase [Bacteroidales bacterium]